MLYSKSDEVIEEKDSEENGIVKNSLGWNKTPAGWFAINGKTASYQHVATTSYLPLETLMKLDLRYGLRQITSLDYGIVLKLIPVLIKHYYSKSDLTGKLLIANLDYATKKILELKINDTNTKLLSETIIKVWRILDEIKRIKENQNGDTEKESKHMEILVSCRRGLYHLEKKNFFSQTNKVVSSDFTLIDLPHAVISTDILPYLDRVSLVNCSEVNQLLYNLCNADSLYERLLLKDFNCTTSSNHKEYYIFYYRKLDTKTLSNGLFFCKNCKSFFWNSKTADSSMCYIYHHPKRITPENIINILIQYDPNT